MQIQIGHRRADDLAVAIDHRIVYQGYVKQDAKRL
jgi:hypothetical protein